MSMLKCRPAVLASFTAVLLSSCAVGPNFSSPPTPDVAGYTPEPLASPRAAPGAPRVAGQRFTNGADIPTRWWAAFRSKPLNDLIRLSIEHNPSLQASEAAIRVAQFNALAQRGLFFPQIGANYTPSDLQQSANGTVDPEVTPQTRYTLHTAQLNVSFTPDIWGQNLRNVESLDAQAEQAQYQLEAAYLTLTANVVTAAIQEASLRGQIAATERIIKIARDILGILKSQFELGHIAAVDVLTQEAALAQVEQTLPPLQKQLAVQRDLLTALAGQFSADEVLQKFDLRRLTLPANLPVSLPSTMVRQRPDVRAAEAALHSSSALVGVAIAARLPNITLSANPGAAAFKFAELMTPGTLFYTVAASASHTVFDGMTLYHKQKAAEAALEQSEALYRQAVITAMQNVTDALRSLQTDAPAVQAAIKAEIAAKASLELIQKQLTLGLINQVIVLNAQQTYFNAAIARVQAEATRLSDVAALFMALGGNWPADCPSRDWRACVFEPPQTPEVIAATGAF
ncbi:efflux transporter outer membrane subunit [Bradyrhizobium sp. U87765 SZCCT0131]|uniref:efflux transporter outer membrane subunit n=1 Tax=unclassified Bradyrhizobium TaxID=2631580 RepID=UPI001BA70EA7|nr:MULTISPECIES: efflux transporter outer membrane subunit [unclassified Bradyrhizobium]MBR1218103.1 efflux transporter outer membrane subunit [Bradyrhizobium sp. U87765 SZCCT0131]MBR1260951.1 efflux transporter outer membrane subunit [Bradyrhizobium sp. U87765 SZCCT0134]MBR1303601.1 efflux transporter outer membrane subunit [Bradyrhizobium sp. U87765 SZCCT0110]MBR1319207.1 efflux transporter outer membrane subunit [Bradyrhizobium sp. U87765 SZCCT0109]MBR1347532.1 efflux transporter outer memb